LTCIALSGYYGFHNIGDEAILEAVINMLRRHRADVRIIVFSADPLHTSQTYGVEAVSRTHLWSILRVLREADLLISGGGGLLQDVTGPRSIPYYLGIMELAMIVGTRVAVYAQGMGPVHHRWSRLWMKKVLSRVDWVSVRDLASAQFVAKLGVDREVVVTADPVLSLEPESSHEINEFWRAHGVEKSQKEMLVGVALRPYPGETIFDERLMEIVSRSCRYLETKYGARLVFLPYHLQKDLPLARELASRVSSRSIIFERGLSSRDTLKLMGGLDLLIGMRLHALIFAAICGVPFLALPYDPKVNAFLGKIGVEADLSLENLSFEHFLASLETALDRKEEWMAVLQEKIREQRKEVEEAALSILSLASHSKE
jgi:polysaccharide pyruvyl transferase CsaB